jgi:hypothetical protein
MKKTLKKEQHVQSTVELTTIIATQFRDMFDCFLKKGFTPEQSFQLLLHVLDKTELFKKD